MTSMSYDMLEAAGWAAMVGHAKKYTIGGQISYRADRRGVVSA